MIEQLKALLQVRQAQEQKMQMELEEKASQEVGDDDRIERKKYAP